MNKNNCTKVFYLSNQIEFNTKRWNVLDFLMVYLVKRALKNSWLMDEGHKKQLVIYNHLLSLLREFIYKGYSGEISHIPIFLHTT